MLTKDVWYIICSKASWKIWRPVAVFSVDSHLEMAVIGVLKVWLEVILSQLWKICIKDLYDTGCLKLKGSCSHTAELQCFGPTCELKWCWMSLHEVLSDAAVSPGNRRCVLVLAHSQRCWADTSGAEDLCCCPRFVLENFRETKISDSQLPEWFGVISSKSWVTDEGRNNSGCIKHTQPHTHTHTQTQNHTV